ncbi:TPA: hypothetical protein ACJW4O_004667 [Salmonella enterica subsp. enterica serovar Grumpensis]
MRKNKRKTYLRKNKARLIFDNLLSMEQALVLDEEVLRWRIQRILNGGNNEE